MRTSHGGRRHRPSRPITERSVRPTMRTSSAQALATQVKELVLELLRAPRLRSRRTGTSPAPSRSGRAAPGAAAGRTGAWPPAPRRRGAARVGAPRSTARPARCSRPEGSSSRWVERSTPNGVTRGSSTVVGSPFRVDRAHGAELQDRERLRVASDSGLAVPERAPVPGQVRDRDDGRDEDQRRASTPARPRRQVASPA